MDKSSLGQLQLFYGNGKGKTTSALGTALRACGNGYSVHLIQVMKNGADSLQQQIPGEINALTKFNNFSFKRFGLGEWYIKGKNHEQHSAKILEALNYAKSCFGKYDIIIFDELLYAIQMNLISEQKVIDFVKDRPKNQELILTGAHKPLEELFKLADLVTEVRKIKHPYDSGVIARGGIEY